jgi:glycosyltransferase 2 family protein
MAHSRRFRIAGVLISIASLIGVAFWALDQPAPKLPDDAAGWLAFAGALGAYAIATGLRSERWLALLRRDGIEARRADAWGLTVVGFMGNNIIPARGGDALSAYLMSNRTQTLFRYTVASLIAMRLLDVVVLVLIYLIVAHGLLAGVDVPGGSLLGLELAVLGLLALVATAFWLAVGRGRFGAAGRLAGELLGTTRRLAGAHGLAMLAVTVLIWVAEAATLLLCAKAVGFGITALESLYLIGLAGIFVLIPSGPGYAGTLDAALLFGARAIGASSSIALSFLLITRFVVFVPITLLGLLLMVTTYGWDSFGLRGDADRGPDSASAGAAE